MNLKEMLASLHKDKMRDLCRMEHEGDSLYSSCLDKIESLEANIIQQKGAFDEWGDAKKAEIKTLQKSNTLLADANGLLVQKNGELKQEVKELEAAIEKWADNPTTKNEFALKDLAKQ